VFNFEKSPKAEFLFKSRFVFGCGIIFFKGGPADPSLQEKEHPTTSKIHATLDSCPL
jgi:hypothetical protein